jgi:glycosyltransferase involved in cell wall biosynthesis
VTANNDADSTGLRVLFTPFYDENPYQEMYESALEKRGISVVRHYDPIPFSLPIVAAVRHRIDIVHLHWIHPYFLFGSKQWMYRVPGSRVFSFWTVHNLHNHEKRYLTLDHWVGTHVAKRADVVQVWDKQTANAVSEAYNVSQAKLVEFPHGNFDSRYESYTGPDPAAELGVDGYERVFLFFGMIRPYKNIPTLIRTFEAVSSPMECLLIAGNPIDDQLRNSVKTAAAKVDNVHLYLKYIPDSAVPTYFAAADICVFPYKEIFNSGSVILAMTFGKPFVAPRKGSIPSISPEGNILYESLNWGLLEAKTLPNKKLASVGDRNRRAALTNHRWDDIADRTKQVYQSGTGGQ